MGGYLGTKAVLLSTTAANVTGNADITGNLTVGGNLTVSGTTITVDHANAQTVDLGDNDKIRLGADYELQLWSDGTTGQISGDINHTGSLTTDGLTVDGNAGIGTTSPNAYSGYTSLTLDHATNGGIIDIERGGNLIGEIFSFDSNTFALSAVGSRAINFSTNSLERMRIDSSGNVGIGTTSPDASVKLHVQGPIGATNGSAAAPTHTFYGDPNTGMYRAGADLLGFATGGSERIRIDNSGNVGIGTNSPSTFNSTGGKLAVASGAGNVAALFSDATYYTLGIKHTGVGSEAVGMFGGTSGSGLALMTNNTERMRIDTSGNVNVGVPTADTSSNYISVTGGLAGSQLNAQMRFYGKSVSNTGATYETARISGGSTSGSYSLSGGLVFSTSSNNGSNVLTLSERMRIDSSGNVSLANGASINTLSSTHSITVQGGAGAAGGAIRFAGGTGDNDLRFYTSSSEHMRLTAGGALGLGTNSPHSTAWGSVGQGRQMEIAGGLGTAGYGVLHLSGSGSNNVIRTYSQGVGDDKFYMAYDADAGAHRQIILSDGRVLFHKTVSSFTTAGIEIDSLGRFYSTISSSSTFILNNGSGYTFYVASNGGIHNYQANNVNLSDQREKKNIGLLSDKWNAVKAWDIKDFHYNADEDSDPKKIGVIAQDVEVNHPELVTGYDITEDETRKAVKEQQMMWMAIKALQEAQQRIETLEASLASAETRLTALEGA